MVKLFLISILMQVVLGCPANCNTCGTGVDSCTACSTGYYLTQGMCIPFCPTGFTENSGVCDPSDTFVFHLSLDNVILDIVEDQRNSIPVLTGSDNSFYPNYHSTDPIAAGGRGYYFTGDSYMSFEAGDGGKELVLAPKFTFAAWVRPKSNQAFNLFRKEDIDTSDAYSVFRVTNEKIKARVRNNLGSMTALHGDDSLTSDQWNFLTFRSYVESSNYKIVVSLNGNTPKVKNLANDFHQDINSNYICVIGAGYQDSSIKPNFHGFLWELRIYNTDYDPSSLLQSSGCSGFGGCSYCPSNNSGQCLPTCDIGEYWDDSTTSCKSCHTDCQEIGCVRYDSSCNLCDNQLCKTCEDFSTCQDCIENASNPGDCECNNKYFWDSTAKSVSSVPPTVISALPQHSISALSAQSTTI